MSDKKKMGILIPELWRVVEITSAHRSQVNWWYMDMWSQESPWLHSHGRRHRCVKYLAEGPLEGYGVFINRLQTLGRELLTLLCLDPSWAAPAESEAARSTRRKERLGAWGTMLQTQNESELTEASTAPEAEGRAGSRGMGSRAW